MIIIKIIGWFVVITLGVIAISPKKVGHIEVWAENAHWSYRAILLISAVFLSFCLI